MLEDLKLADFSNTFSNRFLPRKYDGSLREVSLVNLLFVNFWSLFSHPEEISLETSENFFGDDLFTWYHFRVGKKLAAIRTEIESEYRSTLRKRSSSNLMKELLYPVVPNLLSAKQRKTQLVNGCMIEGKLFASSLELATELNTYRLGQVS